MGRRCISIPSNRVSPASPALRKAIVTGGGLWIRTGEALKGIGVPGETSPFSSNGPSASIGNNSSVEVQWTAKDFHEGSGEK